MITYCQSIRNFKALAQVFTMTLVVVCSHTLKAQEDQVIAIHPEGVEVVDDYSQEQGYYVFYAAEQNAPSRTPIVFVHGYGALNPMIYGRWIRHLVSQGYPVVYPRYQQNLFGTSPKDFVSNAVEGIMQSMKALQELGISTDECYLIGHSYGGVIIANLAAHWNEYEIPRPRIALLCEPGSGPFKGGVLDSYAVIDSAVTMAVVIGDEDETVGQEFGRKVYEDATNTPNRALFLQYACAQDSFEVSASHYEPYALDEEFDNGIENFTSRKARRVARFDHIDTQGYWKIFDLLAERVREDLPAVYAGEFLDRCADLGAWDDGTALCRLEYHCPAISDTER